MEQCIWDGKLIDINDYLHPFEKEKEIRTASDNGELLCVDPNCSCKTLVYCHGQKRMPYVRHKDNVDCDYEKFENKDNSKIRKIRERLYEHFKSMGYNVKQVVKIPGGRHYAHLLFELNGRKIMLQVADRYLSKRQCEAIVSDCKNCEYILNWIVIGDVNHTQDDINNYHISRHVFSTSSDHTLLIVDENAAKVTQTAGKAHSYNNHNSGFRLEGRLNQLVLKDDKFCINGFELKHQQWIELEKKRREELAQKARIHTTYNTGLESNITEKPTWLPPSPYPKYGEGTQVTVKGIPGTITSIEDGLVNILCSNGEKQCFGIPQFRSCSWIKILK